jgi:hypothetical protein
MKIRLMGLPAEVDQVIRVLRETWFLDVTEVSGRYPNRGDTRTVRVYAEVQAPDYYAAFDADSSEQVTGWMTKAAADQWLACAQFAEKQPNRQGRHHNWQLRARTCTGNHTGTEPPR